MTNARRRSWRVCGARARPRAGHAATRSRAGLACPKPVLARAPAADAPASAALAARAHPTGHRSLSAPLARAGARLGRGQRGRRQRRHAAADDLAALDRQRLHRLGLSLRERGRRTASGRVLLSAQAVKACRRDPACDKAVFWGLSDRYTWRRDLTRGALVDATLFDPLLQPKPAYWAVARAPR